MKIFSSWPERQAHLTRWILLLGWLGLIVSLLIPNFDPWPFNVNHCGRLLECHSQEGNQLFWGMVVPTGLLILVGLSHEFWRRICPLAFISQLFRALHWPRTVPGKGGRLEVVKIESNSWLGKHHVQLQWSLFIAGLTLRLLVVNSSTLGLGLFLVLTVAAALLVGWAYGGKAWCQYFCPMAPVQTILTGPRSLFGSAAHLNSDTRITQSMCRTTNNQGNTQSACVACQTPCIDIDSERAYWQTLRGKRGLTWAWYSYPGLVLGFFLLIKAESRGGLDYLRSGMWAYDTRTIEEVGTPLIIHGWNTLLPRFLSLPVLLVLMGVISVGLFSSLESWFEAQLPHAIHQSVEFPRQRTRLLASFVAVNIFFWFADPSLGLAGPKGGQLIRSGVLIVSGMWLYRGWYRDKAAYTRESASTSLRKQLNKLFPRLGELLEGRTLQELSPHEVFTLAKVLPVQINQSKQDLYRGVISDLMESGRIDRASSLVQLEEMRQSLGLQEADHLQALRELSTVDPRLKQLSSRQLEIHSLRLAAAAEAIEEFLTTSKIHALSAAFTDRSHQKHLQRIRREYVLDDASWEELNIRFGPTSFFARRHLEQKLDEVQGTLAARLAIAQAATAEPLVRPLVPVVDSRLVSQLVKAEGLLHPFEPEDPLVNRYDSLLLKSPNLVLSQLHRRDQLKASYPKASDEDAIGVLPNPGDVIDGLWLDPDPDTAFWVLWIQDHREPHRAALLRHQPRHGLVSSAALELLLTGQKPDLGERMSQLLELPMVAGLTPRGMVNMLQLVDQRAGQENGEFFAPHDLPALMMVLRGEPA